MTTYEVSLGERTLRVALRRDATGVFARIDDGPEHRVDLSTVHGALRALAIDDQRAEVLGTLDAEGVAVVSRGIDLRASVLDEARARLARVAGVRTAGHARTELKAPMPGLVVRVTCRVGDAVEAGQPLVVLQAMKMENELGVARSGQVAAVQVEPGATVEQGQVLVVVE